MLSQWQDTCCLCIPSKASIILATKRGVKNGKKGDELKSEDKDNNNTGTAGTHVGESTMPQDLNAPSDGSRIGAHVSKVNEPNTRPTQSVKEILATHAINDPI